MTSICFWQNKLLHWPRKYGTDDICLLGRMNLCTMLPREQNMTREESYLSWTGVSAHVSDVVVGWQGIMPGTASSSRLGSVAVPTTSNYVNKRFVTISSSRLQLSDCSFCLNSHNYMASSRQNLSCVRKMKSRPIAGAGCSVLAAWRIK